VLRRLAVIALLTLVLAPAAGAQPNVILIVTDDQRWDTIGYMPTVQAELAGKGVTFSNAFAVNPVCCPSRASILTGQWSHTNGVWGIQGPFGGFGVFADQATLPVWLDAAGYETMLAGKYLNGYFDASYVPPGWDEWFAHTMNENAYFNWSASDNGTEVTFGDEPADYATDVIAVRATEFIHRAEDPFFLYFAPKAPHYDVSGSVTPAPRHVGAYAGLEPWDSPSVNEPSVDDKPRYVRRQGFIKAERIAELRQDQLESLLAVDEAIAAMLAALDETGKLADTLIVFTSDNGFGWGEHRRMNKVAPYEESIRVPFIVRWDALSITQRTEPKLALNTDVARTVAAAAGLDVRTEGRSLLRLVSNPQQSWRRRFVIESNLWPDRRVPPYCGFRSERWKYVQYETGEEELYDLVRDPYELRSGHRERLDSVLRYRDLVRRSLCRPPGFRPLGNCTRLGTPSADRLRGTRWPDRICAGRGRDVVHAQAGGHDIVRCGPDRDVAVVDSVDRLRDCEIVRRR
jgi:arylsulfatase A-like enzyme